MAELVKTNLICASERCNFVRFTLIDIHGIAKCKSVAAKYVKNYVKDGHYVYSGELLLGPNGELPLWHPTTDNVLVRPKVFYPMPWVSKKDSYQIGQYLCESYAQEDQHQSMSTRSIADAQLKRLDDLGYVFKSAYEIEFYLLDKDTKERLPYGRSQYQTTDELAAFEDYLYKVNLFLSEAGVGVETIECEYSPGQIELGTEPTEGIKAADDIIIIKQALRETASKFGFYATFMSKPMLKCNGNGLHLNYSLLSKKGEYVLHNGDTDDNLSDISKHWIAGIMNHGKALAALHCPSVNCYRRLHGPWAAHLTNWGIDDRSAMLRVKNYSPKATYFENRLPSGVANPYLTVAAEIAAGLDGIMNKLECPAPMSADEDRDKLPSTLQEALEELKKDEVLKESLGKEFVENYVKCKEEYELKAAKQFCVDGQDDALFKWEREEYLPNY